jgi:hypothetical protein
MIEDVHLTTWRQSPSILQIPYTFTHMTPPLVGVVCLPHSIDNDQLASQTTFGKHNYSFGEPWFEYVTASARAPTHCCWCCIPDCEIVRRHVGPNLLKQGFVGSSPR